MRVRSIPSIVALAVALGVGWGTPAQGAGKGGGNAGQAAGALYGDLYVIERDGTGVPVTRNVSYSDPETGGTVTVACQQPLAVSCEKLPLWAESPGFDPELYDPCSVYTPSTHLIQEVSFGRASVARAPAHVVDMSYGEALGLIDEAIAGQCQCDYQTTFCTVGLKDMRAIKLDAAGRLKLCLASEAEPSAYAWKTIDSPLENLGLYRAAMRTGCLGKVTSQRVGEEGVQVVETAALDPSGIYFLNASNLGHLVCSYPIGTPLPNSAEEAAAAEAACTTTPDPVGATPDPPCWWETAIVPTGQTPGEGVTAPDMLSAAAFLAAATDKTSPLSIDEIVNLNNYLGVNLWTYTRVRKQQILKITYFPFTAAGGPGNWYSYRRGVDTCVPGTREDLLKVTADGFAAASIDVFGPSPDGVDLVPVQLPVCRNGAALQANGLSVVCDDPSANPVYTADNINGCGGANWFTQAAEYARKSIWYLHNYELPELAY